MAPSLTQPPLAAARAPSRTGRVLSRLLLAATSALMLLAFLTILALVGADSRPVDFALAVTLAVAPVPLYASLALWMDRFEPEPSRVLFFTFAWGATFAAFAALILNTLGEAIVGASLGGSAAEVYGGSISAPVVEESAKAAVIYGLYRWRRDEFDGVLDGIVYAAMVGLGFAMTENVIYYAQGAADNGIQGAVLTFVGRGVFSPFAHPVFTSMTGIGLGIAARTPRPWLRVIAPPVGLGTAMLLHSTWNTTSSSSAFAGVYAVVMIPVFAGLLVLVAVLRRRESAVILRQLGHYVGAGALNQADVAMLGSLRARRRARKQIRAHGGRDARRALADYQEAAAELAFHRERIERGVLAADQRAKQRELEQLLRLKRRRDELLAMRGAGA
jgi:RsiW-degrading membrane proteinase PrsW (M82 family)